MFYILLAMGIIGAMFIGIVFLFIVSMVKLIKEGLKKDE